MANNNVPMLDLPFFELCNQVPNPTSALSAIATAEDGSDRFIYYMTSSNFYRYDKIADTFQTLATPPVAPLTVLSMRYTKNRGYHGRVLAAASTTISIPGARGKALDGKTIRIERGTGIGQERVLTFVGETIHDAGVITGTTTLNISDTTKKWKFNQWAGHMVGLTFGTDATHYKKVLYNDATTLYFSDANLQPHDPWNNAPFAAAAPYALPVVTAGLQAHYQIMSSQFTVPAWTVVPDTTSYFTSLTGGVYLLSSSASAPFMTFQYWDKINDTWQTKTVPQSLILAAYGTDIVIDRSLSGQVIASNVGVVSGTARTLNDASAALTPGTYNNHRIHLTGGTGVGQNQRIVNHTATAFTVPRNWDTNPDVTTTYEIRVDTDMIYAGGGAAAALFAYSPLNDLWMQGHTFDDGITANISVTMPGWKSLGVTTGTRIALGVQAVNAAPTAGGTNYVIGDILTCSVGGTGAQVIVNSISPGGIVTGIELVHSGTVTGFAVGTAKATTGGTGTGCTIEITTVGPTGLVTTASSHWFARGNSVTFAGCNEGAWNAAHTIIGVNSTSSFSVALTATLTAVASNSQSTTVIVDPSKNWVVNEHVGRLVHLCVAGTGPTAQVRWIVSNTATTLTVATIVAGVNGTSKYTIYDSKIFGIDEQRRPANESSYGQATGGSTTTLADTSKSWVPNQWAGYLFKVEAGTGYGSGRISIVSNTATTLTYTTQGFTPDATTKYEIADSWGLNTAATLNTITEATTKNWPVNFWAGKRIKVTGGTLVGTEVGCTANAATTITVAIGTPDATSTYAILSIPARGAGIQLVWAWGGSVAANKGRKIYFPRGQGSNTLDIYDVTTGRWTFGTLFSGQNEAFTTGSSYAYDGVDGIYLSRSVANQPIRIFKLDVKVNEIVGFATTTILQNAVHVGNFMEIAETNDVAYSFIYVVQNTGTLMCRAMIF